MTSGPSREAQIQQAFMDPLQQKVFQLYVHLGHERSIPKLLSICKTEGIDVSEATLKRWSSKFKWVDLATRTDQQISDKIVDAAMPLHIESMQKTLDYINKLKEEFFKRVDAGEIKVDLADFVLLLKTEALIVGNPTERKETINREEHNVNINLTEDQLERLMRADAANKHGLPPPTPVTYEHNE